MKKTVILLFLLIGGTGFLKAQGTHEIKLVANLGHLGLLPYGLGYETQLKGRFNIAPSFSFAVIPFRDPNTNHKVWKSGLTTIFPLRYYLPIKQGNKASLKVFFSGHLQYDLSSFESHDFNGRENIFAGGLGLGVKSNIGPVLLEIFAQGTLLGRIWKYQNAAWLSESIQFSELVPSPFPVTLGAGLGYRIK